MLLHSLFRFRWKSVVLSLTFFYAIYLFGALDNITDRRDILMESLKVEGQDANSRASATASSDIKAATVSTQDSIPATNPADIAPIAISKEEGEVTPATIWTEVEKPPFAKPKGVVKEPPVDPNVNEYLAFCVAVKDQSRDLPEFLMHHYYNMGVGRFYIMDDGSRPPLETFAQDYGVPLSVLTFDYKPFGKKHIKYMQYALDDRCIYKHGKSHTWMAFIDADEFIETRGNNTLLGMLKELDHKPRVGALAINWRIHGSAGLMSRPDSSRKSFTKCIGDVPAEDGTDWMDNKGIKSIVKVKSYRLPMNPHQFYLHNGSKTVGEHGDVLPYGASRVPITRDRISLHHYAIKSKGEFEEKMTRWSAKGWPYWEHIENYRVMHNCTEMQKYDP